MKKWEKRTLLSAVVMILTGGAMSIVCLGMGASMDSIGRYGVESRKDYDTIAFEQESEITILGAEVFDEDQARAYAGPWGEMQVIENECTDDSYRQWGFVGQEIDSLDLNIDVGEFTVQIGGEFRVEAYDFRDSMRCEVRNGTLFVDEGEWEGFFGIWNEGSNNKNPYIVLTVPEGTVFEKVKYDVGVGSMMTGEITAKSVEIDVDAGYFFGELLNATDKMKVDVDAGSAVVQSSSCQGRLTVDVDAGEAILSGFVSSAVDFDVDAGSAYYEGTISGDWKADCDVGNIELCLEGEETLYNYVVDNDLGNVNIGGQNFGNLSENIHIKNGAAFTGKIDCDLGSVSVSFY